MNKTLIELHQHQGRLVERIAAERAALGRQLAPVRGACLAADQLLAMGQGAARLLRQNPGAVALAVAAIAAIKPRWAWRILRQGFALWRGWRALGRLPALLHALF